MAVQTRAQLQDDALTITNETIAGANTAARVGGLFDNLADTATLDRERGIGSLTIENNTDFTPTINQAVQLVVAMDENILSTYNFSLNKSTCEITYTGLDGAPLRVSANITFSASNNREFEWHIAKDGNIVQSSKADVTMTHNNGHSIYMEAYLVASANEKYSVYVNSINSSQDFTIQSMNFTAVTL